ncbi:hypothetical protein ABPG75_010433 [Micractinium tetrahymenae]
MRGGLPRQSFSHLVCLALRLHLSTFSSPLQVPGVMLACLAACKPAPAAQVAGHPPKTRRLSLACSLSFKAFKREGVRRQPGAVHSAADQVQAASSSSSQAHGNGADWLTTARQAVDAQLAVWEGASQDEHRRDAVVRAMAVIVSANNWPSIVDADDPELYQALLEALPDASPAEAAVCLRGCARLGWGLEEPLRPALHAALLRTLPHAEPAQVADCLWAWCSLEGSLDGQLGEAATAAVQRTAPAMHRLALLRTLAAFHQAPGWRSHLSADARHALRLGLLHMLPSMAPLTLEGSLAAWSRLAGQGQLASDPELAAAAEAALLRVLPALSPQQACNISEAAKAAGWELGQHVTAALAERAAMEERDWGRLAALFTERYSLDPSALPLPGDPALVCAVKEGDMGRLHALLYFGGSIDGGEPSGEPAVDAADAHGATALVHAALRGDVPAARLLLAHGAAADWQEGRSGYSPLGLADFHGEAGVVRLLLGSSGGADPNVQAHDGRTPLMAAVAGGERCREIIHQLAAAGADLEARCDTGMTALEMALENCRPRCAAALLRAGASPMALPPHQLVRLRDLLSSFADGEPSEGSDESASSSVEAP